MPTLFEAKEKKEKEPEVKKAETSHAKKSTFIESPRMKPKNPLAAYLYKPNGIHFESKKKEEEVILLLRRHWITNLSWIVVAFVMAFAPVFLFSFPILNFLPINFQFVALVGWYLLVTAFVLENFLIWYFNVSIITNERIVDIDFYSLLYKKVSEAEIYRIEDVSYQIGGIFRTFFDYGDVYVQTAAEVPNFEFAAVPNPDGVVKVIQTLTDKRHR